MSLISPSRCFPAALIRWRSGRNASLAEVLGLLLEHLGVADDGVQRRPQLVGHVGQELRLVLAGRLQLAARLLDLLEQPGVLDRQHRLAGERLQEIDDGLRKLARRLAADDQDADDPLLANERHGEQRPEAGPLEHVDTSGLVPAAARGEVGDLDGRAGLRRLAEDRVVVRAWTGLLDRRDQLVRHLIGGAKRELTGVRIQLVDRATVGASEASRVRDDRGQHLLEVERRGDGLADLAERTLLLDRLRQLARALLQLLEQAGVLDGDDGLVGERLQQRDLMLGERTYLVTTDGRSADRPSLPNQRNGQRCPVAELYFGQGAAHREFLRLGLKIGHVNGPPLEHARPATLPARDWDLGFPTGRGARVHRERPPSGYLRSGR